jgi:DNA repair protein RadC
MALVSGKRCLSDVAASESRATSIVAQNIKNKRRNDMKPKQFVFYVKEEPIHGISAVNSKGFYERMKDLAMADQESFWVIGFNGNGKEIYHECLFIGGINRSDVDCKIIFKRLLTVGAIFFIVVHNHPGGNPLPSSNDKEVTAQLNRAAKIIGLNFWDHIIIGDGGYFSFYDDLECRTLYLS